MWPNVTLREHLCVTSVHACPKAPPNRGISFGTRVAFSLVLLHEDESNLESGDLVRIDAIGLTADGVTVHGLHPVFSSKGYSESTEENTAQNAGYFSYTYDAKAATSRLEVHALDFNQQLSFKGERRPPEVLSGCSSSVWPRGGPVNGIVFLASLAFLLRLRRRR